MNEPKRIQWILDNLSEPHIEMSEWEEKFFESIGKQFERKRSLSDAQYDKLEEVYTRLTQ